MEDAMPSRIESDGTRQALATHCRQYRELL